MTTPQNEKEFVEEQVKKLSRGILYSEVIEESIQFGKEVEREDILTAIQEKYGEVDGITDLIQSRQEKKE